MMSVKQFFTGSGKINFSNQFISLRLIKEALGKKFKLRLIDESPTHGRYKIIRYTRIYGAPIPFLNPTIYVRINDSHDAIAYDFRWPDYYMVIFAAIIGGLMINIREYALFYILAIVFCGFLVFLDSKYIASRVRRTLSKIDQIRA